MIRLQVVRRTAQVGAALILVLALGLSSQGPAALTVGLTGPGSIASSLEPGASASRSRLVGSALSTETSKPLRRMPSATATSAERVLSRVQDEANEIELGAEQEQAPRTPLGGGQPDPALQVAQIAPRTPIEHKNFPGISQQDNANNGLTGTPPDPQGDVGLRHYVQWVNYSLAVYSKNGTPLVDPVLGRTLWSSFASPGHSTIEQACANGQDGDPIVQYDEAADRWIIGAMRWPNFASESGPGVECMAVSTSGDPTGTWFLYAFPVATGLKMNDAPKLAVWSDSYVLTSTLFTVSGTTKTFAGQNVAVFDRAEMISGLDASFVTFDLAGEPLAGALPADIDGAEPGQLLTLPPAGTGPYIMQLQDNANGFSTDSVALYEVDTNWVAPGSTTLDTSSPIEIPVAAFDTSVCGAAACIPQPGTSQALDALTDRLMFRLQYRRMGVADERLVVNHTVDANGSGLAGVRWYELQKTSNWGLRQQGTFAPTALSGPTPNRWMGGVAENGLGQIALGYSASSTALDPSIRYTGRLAGDPLGTMTEGETTLQAGTGSQTGSNRWGDYSTMSVDPSDDCTFWYTNQYYEGDSVQNWKTRIGAFRFEGCDTDPPDRTPPSSAMITAPTSNWLTTTLAAIPVAWSAQDPGGSGVEAYWVSVRSAAFNAANLSLPTTWASQVVEQSGDYFPAFPGSTYCFSVEALDVAGNVSDPSPERCTTRPANDTAFAALKFKRVNDAGAYLGTVSTTKSKGASLTAANVTGKRFAVIVTKCKGCGSVNVFFKGVKIGTVATSSATTKKRQLVELPIQASVATGELKLTSTSIKPVKIEGIGVSRV